MATTNTCKKNCGCQDSFLTSPAPCPTPQGCPEPEPCSEVFDSQCIIYTGENIICNQDVIISSNTNVNDAFNQLVGYLCDQLIITTDIVCGQDIVVESDTNVINALSEIVNYFCAGSSAVTLTDAGIGTHESLVNDGTGPTLATKGLEAGTGISLSSTATNITITNTAPNIAQNLWSTIVSDQGTTTANTPSDTLNVLGTNGIVTGIVGDSLYVNGEYAYQIGEYVPARGGVIFYRWRSATSFGTPGSGSYQNYLVVDTSDLSLNSEYATLNVDILNAESSFNGELNTTNLIAAGAGSGITVGTAAELCSSNTSNGQNDWYLPALDECSKLYQNRFEVTQGILAAAGTPVEYASYWTSTEINSTTAWGFNHAAGTAYNGNKSSTDAVRAVRKFFLI